MKNLTGMLAVLLIAGLAAGASAASKKKSAAPKGCAQSAKSCPAQPDLCCAKFNPRSWDGKTLTWKNKKFIRDRVREVFHFPLNFGSVITRMNERVRTAKADVKAKDFLLLADENSPWGADLYMAVRKDVPAADNVSISGKFLCKVFEGSYKNMNQWIKEMDEFVKSRKKETKKMYFYYATCPKCAKATGKNYVVILSGI